MRTSELTGRALDWAVAQSGSDGTLGFWSNPDWSPSTKWEHGGPIIERERVSVMETDADSGQWEASIWISSDKHMPLIVEGPTPLIAAMRCYVASQLGDEVDVPGGLR